MDRETRQTHTTPDGQFVARVDDGGSVLVSECDRCPRHPTQVADSCPECALDAARLALQTEVRRG